MRAIYLTGFMGTGKTTIGKKLSEKLSLPMIDTDKRIIERTGKSISSIFESEGEESFRNYESEVLQELATNDIVISTGGGIILREENRIYMKENGLVIHLDCDFNVLVNRLKQSSISKEMRPLFQDDIEELKQRYISRQELYSDADISIDTNKLIDEVVTKLAEWIFKNRE